MATNYAPPVSLKNSLLHSHLPRPRSTWPSLCRTSSPNRATYPYYTPAPSCPHSSRSTAAQNCACTESPYYRWVQAPQNTSTSAPTACLYSSTAVANSPGSGRSVKLFACGADLLCAQSWLTFACRTTRTLVDFELWAYLRACSSCHHIRTWKYKES